MVVQTMDQDSEFMSSLICYLFKMHAIKVKNGGCNHQSFQTRHVIKFLPYILIKHLISFGDICN